MRTTVPWSTWSALNPAWLTTGATVRAAVEASTEHESATDAGAQRHEQHVVGAAGRAVGRFAHRGDVRVVVHGDRAAAGPGDRVVHGRIDEARQVRRGPHDPGPIHIPGHAHPECHPFGIELRVRAAHLDLDAHHALIETGLRSFDDFFGTHLK